MKGIILAGGSGTPLIRSALGSARSCFRSKNECGRHLFELTDEDGRPL